MSASWRLCLWPGSWENEYKPTLALLPSGISRLLVSSFPSWLVPPKMGKLSFPTCQVRVSRFYQSYLLLLLVLLLPTASSRSQWVLPDLNRKFQITVGTAGLQPRVLRISVGIAGPQLRALRLRSGSAHDVRECQVLRQIECQNSMSDRMAEFNVRIDARSAKLECWIECTDVRKNEREREREMPERMSAYARKYVRTDAR